MAVKAKVKIDYAYHAARHMCEGCNKLHGGGRVMTGYVCTAYQTQPSMYVRANQCPMNLRIKEAKSTKIHVGQGKTKAGGNR